MTSVDLCDLEYSDQKTRTNINALLKESINTQDIVNIIWEYLPPNVSCSKIEFRRITLSHRIVFPLSRERVNTSCNQVEQICSNPHDNTKYCISMSKRKYKISGEDNIINILTQKCREIGYKSSGTFKLQNNITEKEGILSLLVHKSILSPIVGSIVSGTIFCDYLTIEENGITHPTWQLCNAIIYSPSMSKVED
jgi:Txe/YoeB family toxin of Txe-Axe toxin-antitoxin module